MPKRPHQTASHLKNEMMASKCFMARSGGVFQRLQIGIHSGVVDPQERIRKSHHVDTVELPLGMSPVHELVDQFLQWTLMIVFPLSAIRAKFAQIEFSANSPLSYTFFRCLINFCRHGTGFPAYFLE